MTYCVAMALDAGMIFASDSRTNAGMDQVARFSKMRVFARAGDRVVVMLSSGNLSLTQSAVNILELRNREGDAAPNVMNVGSLFDVARLLGKVRYEDSPKGFISVTTRDGRVLREEPPVTAFAEGSPAMDLEDDAEIVSKFHDCADPIVGEANARAIRSKVDGLEELDSVRELTALVAP